MKIKDERGCIIDVSEEEAIQRLKKRDAEDIAIELFNNNTILIIDENHYKELRLKISNLETKLKEKNEKVNQQWLQIQADSNYIEYLEKENKRLSKNLKLSRIQKKLYYSNLMIKELEKVKEYNSKLVFSSSLLDEFINQKIKELKGWK